MKSIRVIDAGRPYTARRSSHGTDPEISTRTRFDPATTPTGVTFETNGIRE
jgi:hypothetical protein